MPPLLSVLPATPITFHPPLPHSRTFALASNQAHLPPACHPHGPWVPSLITFQSPFLKAGVVRAHVGDGGGERPPQKMGKPAEAAHLRDGDGVDGVAQALSKGQSRYIPCSVCQEWRDLVCFFPQEILGFYPKINLRSGFYQYPSILHLSGAISKIL